MNSFDARVRYTRMVIENSFLELLSDKSLTKITVTEICRKAGINRATFYKHFLDVQDLFDKMEARLFDQIRQMFDDRASNMESMLLKMMNYTLQEGNRFFILGSDHGDPNLMAKTFQVCYEMAYPILERNFPQMDERKREMLYHFVSQGSGGILTCWIRGGMQETPQEIIDLIMSLCINALKSLEATAKRLEGR